MISVEELNEVHELDLPDDSKSYFSSKISPLVVDLSHVPILAIYPISTENVGRSSGVLSDMFCTKSLCVAGALLQTLVQIAFRHS